jgi:hypothetical protein
MSIAQINANRANAERSTGPKTEGGKAASSRNATRHGLTGKQVVINGEDPAAYEALRRDLIDAYKPADAAEAILVEEIAQNFWRLQRARALEAEQFNLCSGGADPIIGFNSANADFDRLRRYMTSIERAYHRAIEQLQRIQTIRARQDRPLKTPPLKQIGFVSQSGPEPLQSGGRDKEAPPLGFVSQSDRARVSGISSLRQHLRSWH